MNFKNKIRYREKLQIAWKSLMKTYTNTISYRRKQQRNVNRAKIGLLVHACHKCLFQSSNTKCKLESFDVKVHNCVHEDV